VPGTTREAEIEEKKGNERKNRIFGVYLSIAIAKMRDQLSIEEAKIMLKDIFTQEYEARKEQAALNPVLIERYSRVNFDYLKDVWFTGDGVMFVFNDGEKDWFVLFRPSGTEPKLKSYGFGLDRDRLTIDAWAFGFNENVAGKLPKSFIQDSTLMEIWGIDGLKAVDKGRRMQSAWEDFGLVVDPTDPYDLDRVGGTEGLEKRKLIRKYIPPDDHLEQVNAWLSSEGLPTLNIDLTHQPQAMPQSEIVGLLEAVPVEVYQRLGQEKAAVIRKESATTLASGEGIAADNIKEMVSGIAVPASRVIGKNDEFIAWASEADQRNRIITIVAMDQEEYRAIDELHGFDNRVYVISVETADKVLRDMFITDFVLFEENPFGSFDFNSIGNRVDTYDRELEEARASGV